MQKNLTGMILKTSAGNVLVGEPIGFGGQGSVHAADLNGRRVALKLIALNEWLSYDAARKRNEFLVRHLRGVSAEVLSCLPFATFADPDVGVGHLSEIAPGRSLEQCIESGLDTNFVDVLLIAATQAHAMACLEAAGLGMGDVKFENIMLDIADGRLVLRLVDLDNFFHPKMPAPQPSIGAPMFFAPEVRRERDKGVLHPIGPEQDAFSFAVFVHLLVLGRPPVPVNKPERFDRLMRAGWLENPAWARRVKVRTGLPVEGLNEGLTSFLAAGLSSDPLLRPRALAWRGALLNAAAEAFECVHCGAAFLSNRQHQEYCVHCKAPFERLSLVFEDGRELDVPSEGLQLGRNTLGDASLRSIEAAIRRVGPEYVMKCGGTSSVLRWNANVWTPVRRDLAVTLRPGDRFRFGTTATFYLAAK